MNGEARMDPLGGIRGNSKMLLSILSAAVVADVAVPANVSIADPKAIVAALQSRGYQADLDLSGETPEIRSGVAGWKYSIFFQGCDQGKDCDDLLFYAGWDSENGRPTVEDINSFNRETRYARAYIDRHSDPVVEMDLVSIKGEVGSEAFAQSLEIWGTVVTSFSKHIGAE